MAAIKTMVLAVITYAVIAIVLFGDVFKPILLATAWSDRLGAPYWRLIVLACCAVGAFGLLMPARFSLARGPAFVAAGLVGSILAVGAYADHLRSEALNNFGADHFVQQPFRASLRSAPEEFQFVLHAAALKHCVPYGWSYRTISFYRIPLKAAVNVLPAEWIKECGIHRD